MTADRLTLMQTAPTADEAWRTDAACRGFPPGWWYPERGDIGTRAKRICADCPVRQACTDHAIAAREVHGIWGGYAIDERRTTYVGRLPMRVAVIAHGSDAGYAAHRRRGEDPCDDCRGAHARRVQAYKRARRLRVVQP